jgi:4-hydroxybenzoate polyprenyltransferase/phosphoserine phosphatase
MTDRNHAKEPAEEDLSMNQRPLCVDLDGTLVTTDLLWEAWFELFRQNAGTALLGLFRIASGRAAFKSFVAERVGIDAATLPYNNALLTRLKAAAHAGRPIVLVTASPRRWADAVADHLGLFSQVMASDEATNLKGARKGQALVAAFGLKSFDYVGDSSSDAEVWKDAHSAWVVGDYAPVVQRAAQVSRLETVIDRRRGGLRDWIMALRLHQWAKNMLILVPLLGAHQLGNLDLLWACVAAMFAFGCVASANYLLNDLFDIQHDRHHPLKRTRPLAAGVISVPSASLAAVLLMITGAFVASRLPVELVGVLSVYLIGALSYSLYFKRKAPMDAFVLAGLYALRVLAGNAVTGIPPSFWLLAFSIFLFLSLAIAKRHKELLRLSEGEEKIGSTRGRGYFTADRDMISQLGVSAGYTSVLVLALYINSPEAAALYQQPGFLWPLCLVELYWITRLWLIAHRGQLHDDPVIFAIRDRTSQIAALLALMLLYLAQ